MLTQKPRYKALAFMFGLMVLGCQTDPEAPAPGTTPIPPGTPPQQGNTSASSTTTTSPTTSPTTTTSTPTPSTAPLLVESGEEQVCANPSLRASNWFRTTSLASEPVPFASLIGSAVVVTDLFDEGTPRILIAGEDTVTVHRQEMGMWDLADDVNFDPSPPTNVIVATVADYDADGDPDLFFGRDGPNALFRNDGDVLTDVSSEVGLDHHDWITTSGSWGDIDMDGDLDLMVGNYGVLHTRVSKKELVPMPSELYRNDGGTFTDISDWLSEEHHNAYVFMTSLLDLNGDSYPEIVSVHDFGDIIPESRILYNDGGTEFVHDPLTGFHPNYSGMGISYADLNHDGLPDMVQSSLGNISLRLSRESADSLTRAAWPFEWSDAYGLSLTMADEDTRFGWGIEFGDLDNDTDQDLAVLFGWYDDDDDGGWRDITYPDHLYVQDLEMFKEQGSLRGFDSAGHGRGLVLVDINGDGWLDAVKRQLNDAPSMVLTALCGDASWIGVTLEQPTTMNRDAIGAVVDAWIDGTRHRRWMTSGSTSMFTGQDPKAHFGLGDKGTVDHIDITWPDGQTDTVYDLEPNRWHHLIRL